jgi:hypothetical protein
MHGSIILGPVHTMALTQAGARVINRGMALEVDGDSKLDEEVRQMSGNTDASKICLLAS